MGVHRAIAKLIGLAVVTAGALSATVVISFDYTTTGTIAGSHPNIVFNPQSTAVSGSTNAAGNALGLGLGSFTLSKPGAHTTITYNNPFTLDIVFTIPTVTSNTTFDAVLTGTLVNGTGKSSVDLVFSPSSKVFNFTNPFIGSFTFTVHDLLGMNHSAGNPSTYYLVGDITNAQATNAQPGLAAVPEPSSVFLLLTAVGGIGLAMRRRLLHGARKA